MSSISDKGCCYSTEKYFAEYRSVTKINSIRIVTENRPPIERFFWGIATVVTFSVFFVFVSKIYIVFKNAPTMVTFANEFTSIHEVPFPAVTICPETKTQTDLFSYQETANKIKNQTELSEFEKKAFEYLYLICRHLHDREKNEFDDIYFTDDFYKTINELRPKFTELVNDCEWMGRKIDCSQTFTPVFIDQGVCYSFNLLDKRHLFKHAAFIYGDFFEGNNTENDWFDNGIGYEDPDKNETYPRRSFLPGQPYSLVVKMKLREADFDTECKKGLQGIRVVIDNPSSIPQASNHFYRISPQSSTIISVTPKMTTTSTIVDHFSPRSRNCYLEKERPLKYFKAYSRRKCSLECWSNYTLRRCECIHYSMPSKVKVNWELQSNSHYLFVGERNTSICGAHHYKCVSDAIAELTLLDIHLHQTKNIHNQHHTSVNSFCDCLPLCEDLHYDAEVSSTRNRKLLKEGLMESMLIVTFKSETFMKYQRNELYTTGDLVGKFGGLLSVFTGMSVLSVVELIYFLSVRLLCNKYLYGLWTGPNP